MDNLTKDVTTDNGTPVYGYRFEAWTHQVYNRPANRISRYRKLTIYILDDVDRGLQAGMAQVGDDANAAQHRKACNLIFDLFTNEFIDAEVKSVKMARGQAERDFTQFFDNELQQFTPRDLVSFYYHGKAGGRGKDYTWIFRGAGVKKINAFNFIQQVNNSQADCFFLLDCYMPTRFGNLLKRRTQMTEFLIAGETTRDTDGRLLFDDSNFTESLCRSLHEFTQEPKGRVHLTIGHILGGDSKLASNPLRIWLNKPVRRPFKGFDRRVRRFVLLPEKVRENGGLELYACELQGPRDADDSFGPVRDGRDDGGDGRGNGRDDDNDSLDNDEDDDDDSNGGGGGGGGGGGSRGGNDSDSDNDRDTDNDNVNDKKAPRSKKRLLDSFFGSTKKKAKRSPSPDVDITKEEEDDLEIKQERQTSEDPDVEFVGVRPLRYSVGSSVERAIDLTGARQWIDLSDEEDDPE